MLRVCTLILLVLGVACNEDPETNAIGQAQHTEAPVTHGTVSSEGAAASGPAPSGAPTSGPSADAIVSAPNTTSADVTSEPIVDYTSTPGSPADASVGATQSSEAFVDAGAPSVVAPCERVEESAYDCPLETEGYCYARPDGGYCAGPGELAECPPGYVEQEVCLVCGLGGGCARYAQCALPCDGGSACNCDEGVCSEQFCI
jgi:hypothetical protein